MTAGEKKRADRAAVYLRLQPAEQEFFAELKRKVGGEILPPDADVLRLAVREAGEKRGLVWPTGILPTTPDPDPPPPPARAKKGAKR